MLVKGEGSLDDTNKITSLQRLYRRWHGAGLLSLSFMGYLAVKDKALKSGVNSMCLLFHGLASAVMFIAVSDDGVSLQRAFLNPHNALFAGFLAVKLSSEQISD